MINPNILKCAIDNGAVRLRPLACGGVMVSVPDMETTIVLNGNAKKLFDFSKCKRMSRGAAHRAVNSMTNVGKGMKAYYHELIDEKEACK